MGTFGSGPFDNDEALDFLAELDDTGSVREAIQRRVRDAASEPNVDDLLGPEAIAAAALISGAHSGQPPLPAAAAGWKDEIPTDDESRAAALRALEGVTGPRSELRSLWEESDGLDEWLASVARLRAALR